MFERFKIGLEIVGRKTVDGNIPFHQFTFELRARHLSHCAAGQSASLPASNRRQAISMRSLVGGHARLLQDIVGKSQWHWDIDPVDQVVLIQLSANHPTKASTLSSALIMHHICSSAALARASVMRYLASNWPRPPRRHSLSPNFSQPSVRQNLAESSVGTGCQLWLASMLGVLWSPVTISTSGLSAVIRGTAASNSSMRFTLAAKLPSSPVLSVYLKWMKKKS